MGVIISFVEGSKLLLRTLFSEDFFYELAYKEVDWFLRYLLLSPGKSIINVFLRAFGANFDSKSLPFDLPLDGKWSRSRYGVYDAALGTKILPTWKIWRLTRFLGVGTRPSPDVLSVASMWGCEATLIRDFGRVSNKKSVK